MYTGAFNALEKTMLELTKKGPVAAHRSSLSESAGCGS
jgi:hypothetical protein